MIVIHGLGENMKLVDVDMNEFKEMIYPEYLTIFPKLERDTYTDIETAVLRNITKLMKIVDNNRFVGFIITSALKNSKYIQLDYFAILPKYQDKGYGSEALRLLKQQSKKYHGIYIEIEKVGLGNNQEENELRKRRAEFYERLGFNKLNCDLDIDTVIYSPYILPISDIQEREEEVIKNIWELDIAIFGEKRVKNSCKIIYNQLSLAKEK